MESLQKELSHFEKRIEKLHHLQAEQKLVDSRHKHFDDTELNNGMKTDGRKKMDRKLEKTVDSIDKMHAELAARIASRHSELWREKKHKTESDLEKNMSHYGNI